MGSRQSSAGPGWGGTFGETIGVNHSRLKEVTKEYPHDIIAAIHGLAEKGLLVSEGSGRSTFYYRPGHHSMESEVFGAPGICSKSSSEHLDTLREIARPVGSVRKTPRKVVEATILRLCEGRYLTLDDMADLPSHLRCSCSCSKPSCFSSSERCPSHPSASRLNRPVG